MKKSLTFAIFVAAVFILHFCNSSAVTGAQTGTSLFTLVKNPEKKADAEKFSIASVRESEIDVNISSLNEAKTPRLTFPLFDGKNYEAVRESLEIRQTNDFTWRGKITQDKFVGDVILTFKAGLVSGLIYASNGVYEIVPKGS